MASRAVRRQGSSVNDNPPMRQRFGGFSLLGASCPAAPLPVCPAYYIGHAAGREGVRIRSG
jgi:hypothetical protein